MGRGQGQGRVERVHVSRRSESTQASRDLGAELTELGSLEGLLLGRGEDVRGGRHHPRLHSPSLTCLPSRATCHYCHTVWKWKLISIDMLITN